MLRCEHCLRPVPIRGGCRRHPGAATLDLSDPDDAEFAASLSTVRTDGRGRRWSTLGWSSLSAFGAGFVLHADPFSAIPGGIEELGRLGMLGAAGVLSLCLGVHGLGALRTLPDTLRARKHRTVARREAHRDPALRESARDLDRARLLRGVALAGFALITVLISGSIGSIDIGHHDLRGLEGMPTTGLLAALTAVGGAAIVAIPAILLGRWVLVALGHGPEQEAMDATGLVDEGWDLDLELELDGPPAPHRAVTAR